MWLSGSKALIPSLLSNFCPRVASTTGLCFPERGLVGKLMPIYVERRRGGGGKPVREEKHIGCTTFSPVWDKQNGDGVAIGVGVGGLGTERWWGRVRELERGREKKLASYITHVTWPVIPFCVLCQTLVAILFQPYLTATLNIGAIDIYNKCLHFCEQQVRWYSV